MEVYFVWLLFIAWLLSLFGFDSLFIDGVKELFDKDIGIASYYLIFFIVGLIADLFSVVKSR